MADLLGAACSRIIRQLPRVSPAFASMVAAAGCSSIGPATVSRDRTDYLAALSSSWKEQTLSNVVNIRYGDAPSFIHVSSIISSYAMDSSASAGLTVNSNTTNAGSAVPWNSSVFGVGVTYRDRPTISYTPLTGDAFTKRLVRPIPPLGIFELIQAGNPADVVLQVTVRALNGVRNQGTSGVQVEPADPQFYPLLDALRRLQIAGRISVRTEKRGQEEFGILIIAEGQTPQVREDVSFVRDTLNLKPMKGGEMTIAFGPGQRNGSELAVLSRSMGEILVELAMGIDVPTAHVMEGRTPPSVRSPGAENPRDRPLVRIHSGSNPPPRAYSAVRYGDTWYWIDDSDFASKRIFTLLMIFTSLAETGGPHQVPTLTLPVQ